MRRSARSPKRDGRSSVARPEYHGEANGLRAARPEGRKSNAALPAYTASGASTTRSRPTRAATPARTSADVPRPAHCAPSFSVKGRALLVVTRTDGASSVTLAPATPGVRRAKAAPALRSRKPAVPTVSTSCASRRRSSATLPIHGHAPTDGPGDCARTTSAATPVMATAVSATTASSDPVDCAGSRAVVGRLAQRDPFPASRRLTSCLHPRRPSWRRALLALPAILLPSSARTADCQAARPSWMEATAGSPLERYLRALELDSARRFHPQAARAFSPSELRRLTTSTRPHPWARRYAGDTSRTRGIYLLRPTAGMVLNSGFAYGANDGALWAGTWTHGRGARGCRPARGAADGAARAGGVPRAERRVPSVRRLADGSGPTAGSARAARDRPAAALRHRAVRARSISVTARSG